MNRTEDLLAAQPKQLCRLWGNVNGERMGVVLHELKQEGACWFDRTSWPDIEVLRQHLEPLFQKPEAPVVEIATLSSDAEPSDRT